MASKTLILANEATAAQRRVYFDLRDATDGISPETGEAGGQPQISTNGGAWTNTGIGTLTAIGNGRYYADLAQTTVATAGDLIESRYKSANTAETPGDSVQVVAFDPTDANSLGLAYLDAAISSRAPGDQMDLVNAPNATALIAIAAAVEVAIATEGDATALLAAIGAAIEAALVNEGDATATIAAIAAACNAAVEAGTVGTEVTAIKAKTDQLNFTGTDVVATLDGETVGATVSDKTGYKLAADGLDSIDTTAPTGPASDFREMVIMVYRDKFAKSTLDGSSWIHYADDGSTIICTSPLSNVAGVQTIGAAT